MIRQFKIFFQASLGRPTPALSGSVTSQASQIDRRGTDQCQEGVVARGLAVSLARERGYTQIDVEGDGPIKMLLLRCSSRVLLLSQECASWPTRKLELLMIGADASEVWIPAGLGREEGDRPFLRVHELQFASV